MYAGTYSKAACYYALYKVIKFNDMVDALKAFWSSPPEYWKSFNKNVIKHYDSEIVTFCNETYYCHPLHMNTYAYYSIYVDKIIHCKTKTTSLID